MAAAQKRTYTLFMIILLTLAFSYYADGSPWDFGPSLNYARHGLDVVDHNGNIYAIGGWNGGDKLEVLYSGSTSWTELAPLPTQQQGLAAAIVGDEIYTMGSYGPSNICQIYDIITNTWKTGPSIPQALYWSTAEAVGDQIYLIAGFEPGGGGSLDTLYILDTLTGTWSQGPSLPGSIQIPASAVHGNEIYAFGNYGKYYKYDIGMQTWSTFTGPPSGHGYAAEAVTVGDQIFLIGGNSGSIYEAYTNTEIFDPVAQTWTNGPDLNVGRYQFGALYLDSANSIYAVGGRDDTASSLSAVEILDVSGLSLFADTEVIPLIGGIVNFSLNAGPGNANRSYMIFGSITGTTPGVTLPDGTNLPINWDLFTNFTLEFVNTPIFQNFLGTLDGAASGAATFDTLGPLPPAMVGIFMSFAYALPYSAPGGWFASNAVDIEIIP
jgi:hypothetical protein